MERRESGLELGTREGGGVGNAEASRQGPGLSLGAFTLGCQTALRGC